MHEGELLPELPVGFIVERVGVKVIMKPKERVNLAAVVGSFGFVNAQAGQ